MVEEQKGDDTTPVDPEMEKLRTEIDQELQQKIVTLQVSRVIHHLVKSSPLKIASSSNLETSKKTENNRVTTAIEPRSDKENVFCAANPLGTERSPEIWRPNRC